MSGKKICRNGFTYWQFDIPCENISEVIGSSGCIGISWHNEQTGNLLRPIAIKFFYKFAEANVATFCGKHFSCSLNLIMIIGIRIEIGLMFYASPFNDERACVSIRRFSPPRTNRWFLPILPKWHRMFPQRNDTQAFRVGSSLNFFIGTDNLERCLNICTGGNTNLFALQPGNVGLDFHPAGWRIGGDF